MKSQTKIDKLFLDFAQRVAQESHCNRKKVGAILVKDNSRVISVGYNGTPPGEDNCCEDDHNVTKDLVIHAEDNVYRKLLQSTENAVGATLYCTLAPCAKCAHLIVYSGTTRVVYLEDYRQDHGIDILENRGVTVEKFSGIEMTLVEPKDIWKEPEEIRLESLSRCSRCGVPLAQTMGYVCSHPQCPTGMGQVWCNVD